MAVDVIGEDVPDVGRERSPCIEGVQHAAQTVYKRPIAGEGRPTFRQARRKESIDLPCRRLLIEDLALAEDEHRRDADRRQVADGQAPPHAV